MHDDDPNILEKESSVAWVANDRVWPICHKSVLFSDAKLEAPKLSQRRHTIKSEHTSHHDGKTAGKEGVGDWSGAKGAHKLNN